MSAPGVGIVAAPTFNAVVDDPKRFRRSKSVATHFGLTAGRCQSREQGIQSTYIRPAMSRCGRPCSWRPTPSWTAEANPRLCAASAPGVAANARWLPQPGSLPLPSFVWHFTRWTWSLCVFPVQPRRTQSARLGVR